MMIEMGKKYQTRDGRAVRLLCVDGPGEDSVIGIVEGEDRPDVWTLSGSWYDGDRTGSWDLVPVKELYEGWVIIQDWVALPVVQSCKKNAEEYIRQAHLINAFPALIKWEA
jgi:hypothetical protein